MLVKILVRSKAPRDYFFDLLIPARQHGYTSRGMIEK